MTDRIDFTSCKRIIGRMYKKDVGTALVKMRSDKWYAGAYQGFVKIELTISDDKFRYRLGQIKMIKSWTRILFL